MVETRRTETRSLTNQVFDIMSVSAAEQNRLARNEALRAYLDSIDPGLYEFVATEILGISPSHPAAIFDLFAAGSFGVDQEGDATVTAKTKKHHITDRTVKARGIDLHSASSPRFKAFLTTQLPYANALFEEPSTLETAITAAARAFGHYKIRRDRLAAAFPPTQAEKKALLEPITPELVIAVQTIKSIPAQTSDASWVSFNHSGLSIKREKNESTVEYTYRSVTIMLERALSITQNQVANAANLETATMIISQVSDYIVTQAISSNTPVAVREQLLVVGLGILGENPNLPDGKYIIAGPVLKEINFQKLIREKSEKLDVSLDKRLQERYFAPILNKVYAHTMIDHPVYGKNRKARAEKLKGLNINGIVREVRQKFPDIQGNARIPNEARTVELYQKYQARTANEDLSRKKAFMSLLVEMLKIDGANVQFAELSMRLTRKRSALLAAKTPDEVTKSVVSWIRVLQKTMKGDALTPVMDVLLATNSIGGKLFMDILAQMGELNEVMDAYRKTAALDVDGEELIHAAQTDMTTRPGEAWVRAASSSQTVTVLGALDMEAKGVKTEKHAKRLAEKFKLAFLQSPVFCLAEGATLSLDQIKYNLPLAVTTSNASQSEKAVKTRINTHMAEAVGQIIGYMTKTESAVERQLILTMLVAMLADPTAGTSREVLKKYKIQIDVDWRARLEQKILPLVIQELKVGLSDQRRYENIIDLLSTFGPSMLPGTKNVLMGLFIQAVDFDKEDLADNGRWTQFVLALGLKSPEIHLNQISKNGQRGDQSTLGLAIHHSNILVSGYGSRNGVGEHDGVAKQLIVVAHGVKASQQTGLSVHTHTDSHSDQTSQIEFTPGQITELKKTIIGQSLRIIGPLSTNPRATASLKAGLIDTITVTLTNEVLAMSNFNAKQIIEQIRVADTLHAQAAKEFEQIKDELNELLNGNGTENTGLIHEIKVSAATAVKDSTASPLAAALGFTEDGEAERIKKMTEALQPLMDLLQKGLHAEENRATAFISSGDTSISPTSLAAAASQVYELAARYSTSENETEKRKRAKEIMEDSSITVESWLAAHANDAEIQPKDVMMLAEILHTRVAPFLQLNNLRFGITKAFFLMSRQKELFTAMHQAEENKLDLQDRLDLLAEGIDPETYKSMVAEINAAMIQLEPNFKPISIREVKTEKKTA